jgi:hypothetical protein
VAASTGIILAAGTLTLANEAVFAPLASGGKITAHFNWRIIPATAGAALALAGLEHLSERFATGVAWIALITVLFAKLGNAQPPVVNAARMLGYNVGKV